jgi:hypothetical protein
MILMDLVEYAFGFICAASDAILVQPISPMNSTIPQCDQ